jgi:hypothetical protein
MDFGGSFYVKITEGYLQQQLPTKKTTPYHNSFFALSKIKIHGKK